MAFLKSCDSVLSSLWRSLLLLCSTGWHELDDTDHDDDDVVADFVVIVVVDDACWRL
jgi:hypothetical protein